MQCACISPRHRVQGRWPNLAGLPTGAWLPSASMAGGGTSPALHGGLPDWFAGAATATLGSEWLRVDFGTPGGSTRASPSITKEVPSQAIDVDEENEWLPVRATSGPIRGSSSCRRGGRVPRLPPSRTAPVPASVDVDLTSARYEPRTHISCHCPFSAHDLFASVWAWTLVGRMIGYVYLRCYCLRWNW
jgi:hypothetical protein